MLDDAQPNELTPKPNPPKSPSTAKFWIFGTIALAFAFAALKPKTVPDVQTPSHTAPNTLSSDTKEKMAMLINISGQLCATVTDITRISGDLYRATCTRYRDGTGTASYEVDAATGAVK